MLLAGLAVAGVLAVVTLLSLLDRDPPPVAHCTAGPAQLAPDQAANAALIVGTTLQRDLPARAGTIGIATAMQESRMRNIDYGDRDSLGMFQQRPSQGWGTEQQLMDPVYAVNAFFDVLVTIPDYTDLPVTEAAQAVQRSAFPDAYAQHEPVARAFASALAGWTTADLTCVLDPFSGDPATVAAAAQARSERDLGVTGELRAGSGGSEEVELVLNTSSLSGDPERNLWATAQAAVAAAVDTGAGRVSAAGWTWERSTAGWREMNGAEQEAASLAADQVLIAPE